MQTLYTNCRLHHLLKFLEILYLAFKLLSFSLHPYDLQLQLLVSTLQTFALLLLLNEFIL